MNPNAVAVGATNAAGVVVEGNVPPPGVAVGAPGVVDTVESLATAVETLQVTGAPHVGALPVGHGMDAQGMGTIPGMSGGQVPNGMVPGMLPQGPPHGALMPMHFTGPDGTPIVAPMGVVPGMPPPHHLAPVEPLPPTCVLRMRGLPYQATEEAVAEFFSDFEIPLGGTLLCLNSQGRATGDGYVRFANEEDAAHALETKNRAHMGRRYVELFPSTEEDMVNAHQRSQVHAQAAAQAAGALPGNPDPRYPGVVRMRGLPFSAGAEQVLQFFQGCGGDVVPEGILLTYTHDGRATGEAYVEFVTADGANLALNRHRQMMGTRYIELFRSTKGEMMQAAGAGARSHMFGGRGRGMGMPHHPGMGMHHPGARGFHPHGHMGRGHHGGHGPGHGGMMGLGPPGAGGPGTPGGMPGHPGGPGLAAGFPADAVAAPHDGLVLKLRGLPYSAGMKEVTEFFSDYELVPHGILVVMRNERSTGEAYVMFANHEECNRAREQRNKARIGQRYVELFRSSHAEMSHAAYMMGSNIPLPTAPMGTSAQQALLPPDMHLMMQPGMGGAQAFLHDPAAAPFGAMGMGGLFGYPQSQPQWGGAGHAPMGMGTGGAGMVAMSLGMSLGPPGPPGPVDPAAPLPRPGPPGQLNPGAGGFAPGPAGLSAMAPVGAPPPPPLESGASAPGGVPPPGPAGAPVAAGVPPPVAPQGSIAPAMAGAPAYAAMAAGLPQGAAAAAAYAGAAANGGAPTTGAPAGVEGSAPAPAGPQSSTVRLRGLPWQSTPQDVLNFLSGFAVVKDSVRIGQATNGRATGEAMVTFASASEAGRAVSERHRAMMGNRYVELFLV
ncbi:hypothetical protein PPROV_000705200 [Pycnococcus provasolii]|uniref:RRM domain-containing protein n=1 Tax=Pycnococcus provasolii TaxID=41880 RepID=A0A830HN28_9CHLO|nr:hypothetical protein PPROV_000705200 [Pycnococcus provasolii]